MRNVKIILGGVAIAALATAAFTTSLEEKSTDGDSAYKPRVSALKTQSTLADEERKLFEELRADQTTGVFDPEQWKEARDRLRHYNMSNNRAASITWVEMGPDNIGGRTRAVHVDVNDDNHIFAGSVSGGLFESFDAGNTWNKVAGFTDNLAVSCIGQSTIAPYKILVGTAHNREGFVGDGVFESDDNGVTWSQITTTASYSNVNEIIYSIAGGKFFISSSSGLKEYDGTSVVNATGAGAPSGACESMASSPDGSVMVVGNLIGGTRTYVTADAGANWAEVSGNISTGEIPSGASRTEYAVSHETDASTGKYFIYASAANSTLYGQFVSNSNGESGTWVEIAPSSTPLFQPFTSAGGQGTYDNIITVFPGNPGKALLGGIDVYEWRIDPGANPIFGQWEQKSFWFASPSSIIYVHADQHEMKWDSQGNLIGGNDGGVYKSFAGGGVGDFFFPTNKGYNVTQFYGIGYSAHGEVIGGTQDNGTLYNDFTGNSPMEFQEVMGGDGFDCDISFLFPDVQFTSIYYAGIERSDDRGFTGNEFFSGTILSCGTPGATTGGLGTFTTVARLWETDSDANSTDSVIFLADSSMNAGDTAWTTGYSQQNPLWHILTSPITVIDTMQPNGTVIQGTDTLNFYLHPVTMDTIFKGYDAFLLNVPLDTIKIQDQVQSWYAVGIDHGTAACGGVWFTRDALRFANNPFWWHINTDALGTSGRITAIEFSADGDHMYCATSGGEVIRVSGLGTLYGNNLDTGYAQNDADILPSSVTATVIYNGSYVAGIGIDPQDADHVVITLAGFGTSNVLESLTAATTTGTGSFSSIHGNMPSLPVYDAVIDMNDPNLIIVGTEFGVYATDDGGSTWTDNSGDFGAVPTYSVRQNWRTWNQGNKRPGELYAGTYGRGIWASGTYLSTPDQITPPAPTDFISSISIYPNPMQESGTIAFELEERANVTLTVYSLSGRKVKEINLGNRGAGEQLVQFNTDQMAGGTYFIDLRAGQSRKTAKFIVSK